MVCSLPEHTRESRPLPLPPFSCRSPLNSLFRGLEHMKYFSFLTAVMRKTGRFLPPFFSLLLAAYVNFFFIVLRFRDYVSQTYLLFFLKSWTAGTFFSSLPLFELLIFESVCAQRLTPHSPPTATDKFLLASFISPHENYFTYIFLAYQFL